MTREILPVIFKTVDSSRGSGSKPDLIFQEEPESCATCRQGVSTIFKDWTDPSGTELDEELFLMDNACPQMPDIEICEEYVITWWEKISSLIFSETNAGHMCHEINPECEAPQKR